MSCVSWLLKFTFAYEKKRAFVSWKSFHFSHLVISTWLIAWYLADLVCLGGTYESGSHCNQCKDPRYLVLHTILLSLLCYCIFLCAILVNKLFSSSSFQIQVLKAYTWVCTCGISVGLSGAFFNHESFMPHFLRGTKSAPINNGDDIVSPMRHIVSSNACRDIKAIVLSSVAFTFKCPMSIKAWICIGQV